MIQELLNLAENHKYPPNALLFVQRGLEYTVHRIHGDIEPDASIKPSDMVKRHITGQQLCIGLRDYALLMFLYNTGARVQEVVDLKISDLRLQTPLQVKLTGKGNKERLCPLWPETVEVLEKYLSQRKVDAGQGSSLFLNANGKPITRFGIRYIVRRYCSVP